MAWIAHCSGFNPQIKSFEEFFPIDGQGENRAKLTEEEMLEIAQIHINHVKNQNGN